VGYTRGCQNARANWQAPRRSDDILKELVRRSTQPQATLRRHDRRPSPRRAARSDARAVPRSRSSAIRRAVAGERIVDSGLAAAASEGDSPLTAHEHEVLVASREHATAQVAAALHLSPGATRNHLSAITGKLGTGSRIEALRVAEDKGWL
jgi:two-component system response regulator DesR